MLIVQIGELHACTIALTCSLLYALNPYSLVPPQKQSKVVLQELLDRPAPAHQARFFKSNKGCNTSDTAVAA